MSLRSWYGASHISLYFHFILNTTTQLCRSIQPYSRAGEMKENYSSEKTELCSKHGFSQSQKKKKKPQTLRWINLPRIDSLNSHNSLITFLCRPEACTFLLLSLPLPTPRVAAQPPQGKSHCMSTGAPLKPDSSLSPKQCISPNLINLA